eukprot:5273065-Amphidinium_carterae.1
MQVRSQYYLEPDLKHIGAILWLSTVQQPQSLRVLLRATAFSFTFCWYLCARSGRYLCIPEYSAMHLLPHVQAVRVVGYASLDVAAQCRVVGKRSNAVPL